MKPYPISNPSPSPDPDQQRLTASRPLVTVDLVVFTVLDGDLKVLLSRRAHSPFEGTWALLSGPIDIGGFAREQGEDLEEAAHRALVEQTGLPAEVEQLHTFGRSGRDPRWRALSVSWIAMIGPEWAGTAASHDPDVDARWFSVEDDIPWLRLAFDHAEILASGVDRLRKNLGHNDQVYRLVPQQFTVGELQAAHEAIRGESLDERNFRRRFQGWVDQSLVAQAPGKRARGRARPAKIWRRVDDSDTVPPE